MFATKLTLFIALFFGLLMVTAAPSRTSKYKYRVAKRADIIRRATRTRPLHRRASPLPPGLFAVFENYQFAGTSTATSSSTIQPTFGSCAALCTATSDCTYFRWVQTGAMNCYLRTGVPGRSASTTFRAALKGVTCAQAKATYTDLASATCTEEFH